MRPVHSLLMYLFTAIAFAVTTSQSAVRATNCKLTDQSNHHWGREQFILTTETTVRINTVMTQLSCGTLAGLSSITSGITSCPKGFWWSWPSARVASELSLAALPVRCIGVPGVGLPMGLGATNLTVF